MDHLHTAHTYIVSFFGGTQHAHFIVGNVYLLILVILTCVVSWYAMSEIFILGIRILRIILMLVVVAVALRCLLLLYEFVYDSDENRLLANQTIKYATNKSKDWMKTYVWDYLPSSFQNE